MRRFCRQLLAFLALQAAVWLVVVAVGYRVDPNGYMAAIVDKHRQLAETPAPRIVLVGTSSLAFSVDSAIVRELTARPVVNMGLNAGLGLEFVLAEVKAGLRPGDVVVASFPYEFFGPPASAPEAVTRAIEYRPALLREMSWSDLAPIVWRHDWVFGYVGLVSESAIRRLTGKQLPGPPHALHRRDFNAFGDVISHRNRPQLPALSPMHIPKTLSEQALDRIEAFVRFAQSRGVRFVYVFPAVPTPAVERGETGAFIERVSAALHRRGIPFLTDAREVVWPVEDFFDTEYHLRGPAIARYSTLLGERLRRGIATSFAGS